MNQPKGIQLSRSKGYRKPPGAIVVARPSRWGNPHRIGHDGVTDAAVAVELFKEWLAHSVTPRAQWMRANLHLLRSHDLACWCKVGSPCHRDVLLRLANPLP